MSTATTSKPVKIIKIIANVLVWLFVAFSVFVTILVFTATSSSDGVPSIKNKCIINILTDSMNPTFNAGDMIIGEKISDEEKMYLEIGDIISYHVDLNDDNVDEINTHRIVEIEKNDMGMAVRYTTQGDNKDTNQVVDKEPVLPTDIIAIYSGTTLPGVGAVISFLQTSTGFLVVIVLPLIAFFIYELIKFILTVASVRNEGKKQITAADEEVIKQKAVEEFLKQQAAEKAAAEAAAEKPAELDEEAIKQKAIEEYKRQQEQAQREEEIKKKAIEEYLKQQAAEPAEENSSSSDNN